MKAIICHSSEKVVVHDGTEDEIICLSYLLGAYEVILIKPNGEWTDLNREEIEDYVSDRT